MLSSKVVTSLGVALGVLLQFTLADNPIIQTIYTADPAPYVYNNTVWLFADHDEDGSKTYNMKDWRLYSSIDMANWRDWGVVMSLKTFSWARADAWAAQAIEREGKFYFYASMTRSGASYGIGVGVSDTITGPYRDPIGKPIVANGNIDPTVWIDDDGQAYLYWGNPGFYYVKLNKDMISYSGSIVSVPTTQQAFGPKFAEGPWVYKRNGTYYNVFAANCCPEDIRYSTSPSPTGPWTYRGVVMATAGGSFTNHPAVIDYKGGSYFFYHNGALPGGSGYTRSIAVEKFSYGADGSIPTLKMTDAGARQIESLNPYMRVEAETIAFSKGLRTETSNDGGIHVAGVNNGDYLKVKGVDFGAAPGAATISLRVAAASGGGKIELHLGSLTGTLAATCTIDATGGATTWKTVSCPVTSGTATGKQDLFFKFVGNGSNDLFTFNWWQFNKAVAA
ncbi:glycosyl hydrolase [Podospora didyma]|uniref:Glycosyl hydrolase n=1 Tax=Podospora didyma TaxID=330526 RepID=A0AAE0K5A1_9PEZI|nr:glycosyl hydrolase [Podospora didyma]